MAVKRARHARTTPVPRAVGLRFSPVAAITLALLFLLPIFFTPGELVEEFEFTKVLVLATGALLLLAWWIGVESSRLLAAGIGSWIAGIPGRIKSSVRRDPLGGAVGLMLVSAALSTIFSVRPPLSLFGAPQSHAGLRTVFGLAAIYYASRSLASAHTRWFRSLAQAAGLGAAVAAAYSLVQIAHLDPITWSRQSSFNGLIRSGSTVGHANTLSAYLVVALPLVVWLASRARARALALGWFALAAASLFIVIAGLSRGAWLGAAAGFVAAGWLSRTTGRLPSPRAWGIAAMILAAAVLIPLVTPMREPVLTRLSQVTDTHAATSRTRLLLWSAGLRMFADHPVLGVGLDAFVAAFPRYRTAELTQLEWGGTPAKAHNDAIQILSTQGAVGGLAALAIVLLTALGLWRIAKRAAPDSRAAAIAAGAALAAYVASSLVGFGTVATGAVAAALAGWVSRESHARDAGQVDEGAAGLPAAIRGGRAPSGTIHSWYNLAAGVAIAAGLGLFLVVRPLRGERYLARALHEPSGSGARDGLLQSASEAAPWDPRYPAEIGRSYFFEAIREQDPERRLALLSMAHESLGRSVAIAPENSENRILYASVLSAEAVLKPESGSRGLVRDEFHRAVALDPLSPTVLVGAERGLIAAGLTGEARELALRCARAYPDYAPPLADLGSIAMEEGRGAAAADTLKLAVRRNWREDPEGAANAWNDLARASLMIGDPEQASVAADSALARNPALGAAFATKEAAKRTIAERKGAQAKGK